MYQYAFFNILFFRRNVRIRPSKSRIPDQTTGNNLDCIPNYVSIVDCGLRDRLEFSTAFRRLRYAISATDTLQPHPDGVADLDSLGWFDDH